jgi:predicted RNA-binding protein with PUA-like domain
VRNYQARNFLRDDVKKGDRVLFYHSGGEAPAVAGTAVVVREAYPDHTAWNKKSDHFDPKASPEKPIWQMVDICLEQVFPHPVPLSELRQVKSLAGMELLKRGSRLSIQPITKAQFETIVKLAGK